MTFQTVQHAKVTAPLKDNALPPHYGECTDGPHVEKKPEDTKKSAAPAPSNSSLQNRSNTSQRSTANTGSAALEQNRGGGGQGDEDSDGEDDRRGGSMRDRDDARNDGTTDLERNASVNEAGFRKNGEK